VNCWSQTRVIEYLNNARINVYCMWQTTVEASTFGLEFVAMQIAVERAEALRYKLQMFGVRIHGWIDILCNNMRILLCQSWCYPSKKHTLINHCVQAGLLLT
jgi:hypothetical protein